MSQYKYAEIAEIIYFWFAANTTAGAAGDGATPLYDVRLAGALSTAAPTASGTPTLLTHVDYTDGLHEIAINTTGYAAGEYAVFCTLTISTVNPAGFCGSFKLRTAGTGAIKTDFVALGGTTLTAQIIAAIVKFFDKASPTGTVNSIPDAVAGQATGLAIVGSSMVVPNTQKVDVETIKTQVVTCAAGVTVLASVGASAAPGANGGLPTTNGTKVNQTVDLTAGQTIATSGVHNIN